MTAYFAVANLACGIIPGPELVSVSMLPKSEFAWAIAAQSLIAGAWIILLPVALRHLPVSQVGLWLMFINLCSFAQLLELGFQPTISRNVAYVYAGARKLLVTGVDTNESRPVCPYLLATLMTASKQIYRLVALVAGLFLLISGTSYILTIMPPNEKTRFLATFSGSVAR
jgi:hypothetical protein